jgi:hypothetical protein
MKILELLACAAVGAGTLAGGALAQESIGGSFAMPRDVVSAATAFGRYMAGAARIDAGFASGGAVAKSLEAAASYEPAQLEEGMIAYGAIAALQDDRFVAGVERAAGRGEDRAAFGERLIEDPFAATRIDGAEAAAQRIEAALGAKAGPLISAANQVKAAAYSVQHQAWSRAMVADAEARLAAVKRWSAARAAPTDNDNEAMMSEVAGFDPFFAADGGPAGFTPIEARALALAAEAVLGRAGGAERDRLSPLLSDADSAECLKMAKLNLYQCMAVAGPQYEDIYCLGQHAMLDTGECVGHATHEAGGSGRFTTLSSRSGGQASALPMVAHRSLRADPD